jgi:hypothetical protein
MKKFSQFLSEAGETTVSSQARKMGLKGDGHGGWYDQQGNFKAKTVDGKLKVFSGREAKAEEEKQKQKKAGADAVRSTAKTAAATPAQQQQPAQQQPAQATQAAPEEEGEALESTGAVIVFGRFNPPTIGHEKLLKAAATQAKREDADLAIYPSRTQDKKKNPLDPKTKIGFMKSMFPDYEENIFDDNNAKTIFDVLTAKYAAGYKSVTIMVGQDRLAEFQGLAQKYNGSDLYAFDEIKVVSAGARDPDADDVSGMSASKLRAHAAEDDFNAFSKGVPNKMTVIQKKEMFNAVRKSMNIKEELWQIAPKFDPESLRESYVKGKIFRLGDIVENLNTGLVGRVNRRGTNYIICVTEDGIMFKSWLRDIKEYSEVSMNKMMRDKKHPNTLVGTAGFLKYVQSMTPGSKLNKRYIVKVGRK